MPRIFANPFDYPNRGSGITRCYLQVYQRTDGLLIAVATEVPWNDGTSITNAIESIADGVRQSFQIAHEDLVLIEHYPARAARRTYHEDLEIFSHVGFKIRSGRFRQPQWTYLPRMQVEGLIEQQFDSIN
jgi:hypothetical protein